VDRCRAEHLLERVDRGGAATNDPRRVVGDEYHGRPEPASKRAAVDVGADPSAEIATRARDIERRRGAAGVGARRRERLVERRDQTLCDRVTRDPDADPLAAAGERRRQPGARRQHERQRSRPEARDQTLGGRRDARDDPGQHGGVTHDERDRLVGIAALQRRDAVDGRRVQRARAESVERLRRIDDRLATRERRERRIELRHAAFAIRGSVAAQTTRRAPPPARHTTVGSVACDLGGAFADVAAYFSPLA